MFSDDTIQHIENPKVKRSEVAQSCPTLCDPMYCTRLLCPWDFLGKNTREGYHLLLMKILKTTPKTTRSNQCISKDAG